VKNTVPGFALETITAELRCCSVYSNLCFFVLSFWDINFFVIHKTYLV